MAEDAITSAVTELVKAANILGSSDLAFHRSLDSEVSSSLDSCLQRLLGITTSLLDYATDDNIPILTDLEDVNSRWGDVIDVVDTLLERTDASLEELNTKNKKEQEIISTRQQNAKPEKPNLPASLRNAQDLPHPQLKFRRKPDNSDNPWEPLLTNKVNAKLNLEESLHRPMSSDDNGSIGHPYAFEIETIEYPGFLFEEREPVQPQDAESSAAIWVDTEAKLQAMLEQLKESQEIAVDLEHHDFHSFVGFVCLMQISNRQQDWIVDTLALREELQILNEVFTDPRILKVFHGANSDIRWLQRDFGLYIVNLFDTYHASRALGLEGHGLAFLLNTYVNFEADKRYQLADWRIRPLPKEMLYYARSDTHYLLYIYDIMRNELLQKSNTSDHNAMTSVLKASAGVSLLQYAKEPYDAAEGQGSDGWMNLLTRYYRTRTFNSQQLEVMKALHQWRDLKAREIDESTRFILPNSTILSIAAALPNDLHSLQKACQQISSTMQSNMKNILKTVQLAIKHADGAVAVGLKPAEAVAVAVTAGDPKPSSQRKTVLPATQPSSGIDYKSLVTSHSIFWGPLVKTLKVAKVRSPLEDLRLALPMPPLSSQIYENDTVVDNAPEIRVPSPLHQADVEPPSDIFIVKEVGKAQDRKRKSEVIDLDAEKPESAEIIARREARRRAKQEKAEARAKAAAPVKEEIVPFDYAAQPSLLKEPEQKKIRIRKFGEFSGKIVKPKRLQVGKQSTFKR